jgi:hypothetical protein
MYIAVRQCISAEWINISSLLNTLDECKQFILSSKHLHEFSTKGFEAAIMNETDIKYIIPLNNNTSIPIMTNVRVRVHPNLSRNFKTHIVNETRDKLQLNWRQKNIN